MYKRYNIVVKIKTSNAKSKWLNIGTLMEKEDGTKFGTLYILGKMVKFNVFAYTPKPNTTPNKSESNLPKPIIINEEGEEIPF